MGDFGWNKGDPTGVQNAQTEVFFSCDFVGGIIEVAWMDVGERGDVHIKITTAGPLEGRILGEVEGGNFDKRQDLVGGDLALHVPEVSCSFLVLPSGAKENEMEYQYEVLSVDGKESQMVNPFGVAPRNTEEDFVWGANNIR